MNDNFSIMSWNVRGLNDSSHRELVRENSVCSKPSVICIQETKISSMSRAILTESLGDRMADYCTLDAVGTRGGVLLAWNREMVQVSEVLIKQFSISATVVVLSSTASFRLTTCYGPADDRRKEDFLLEMKSTRPVAGTPWIILGDFNLIYKASDKNNLNLNRRLMGRFRAALDECELMEICLQNRRYTWSNERQRPTLVRLDRAFCNGEWELLFPNYALHALSTGVSDHTPILLTRQDVVTRKARFRFEDHWMHVDGFMETVQQAWSKQQSGSALTIFRKKT